jgi:acyl carrier protein
MKEQIVRFIKDTFITDGRELAHDEPLFESGLIDSLGFIKLLEFIEKKFNISIAMSEVTMDKFETIDGIEKFIEEKLK